MGNQVASQKKAQEPKTQEEGKKEEMGEKREREKKKKIPSEMGVAPPHKRFTQFSTLIKL